MMGTRRSPVIFLGRQNFGAEFINNGKVDSGEKLIQSPRGGKMEKVNDGGQEEMILKKDASLYVDLQCTRCGKVCAMANMRQERNERGGISYLCNRC